MVLANLRRASDLIQSFKLVAVDQSGSERRRFDLHQYLQEVVRSLGPQLKRSPWLPHETAAAGRRGRRMRVFRG